MDSEDLCLIQICKKRAPASFLACIKKQSLHKIVVFVCALVLTPKINPFRLDWKRIMYPANEMTELNDAHSIGSRDHTLLLMAFVIYYNILHSVVCLWFLKGAAQIPK